MSLIFQSTDMERLECFSNTIQAISDEANKVCKGLVTVSKKVETDYDWEVTYFGKSVSISSDEILKILNQNTDTNYKEKFKELIAWKMRAV